MSAARVRHDRGQASVEFALALPFVAMLLLGIVQVVVVVRDQLAVGLAAREGARAASVAADPSSAAARAANDAVALTPLSVSTSLDGGRVTVHVSYTNHTSVALIGHVMGNVELDATVTMAREPP